MKRVFNTGSTGLTCHYNCTVKYLALDAGFNALAGIREAVELALAAAHLPGDAYVFALLLLGALDGLDPSLAQQRPTLTNGQRLRRLKKQGWR